MGTIPGTATVFLRNSILFRKYQDILSKAYFLKLKNKTEVFKYNPKQYSVIYLVPFFFKATRMILYHQNKINYLFSDNYLNYLSIYLSIYLYTYIDENKNYLLLLGTPSLPKPDFFFGD